MADSHEHWARRCKVAALVGAIAEYNAHFPADPITAAAVSALSREQWETLARCAASLARRPVNPPGTSGETVAAVAVELLRRENGRAA